MWLIHAQFDAVKSYISGGGCVLVLLGEGGETKHDTNINFLLEEYGVVVNAGTREMCDVQLTLHRRGGAGVVLQVL